MVNILERLIKDGKETKNTKDLYTHYNARTFLCNAIPFYTKFEF